MKQPAPRLDRHGFPIAPDFDEAGVADPGQGGSNFGLLRGVLKLAIVCGVLTAIWLHYDVGAKIGRAVGEYHARQAQTLAGLEQWDQAIEQVDRALAWSPNDVTFLQLRASINYYKQDYAECLADVARALELKSNDFYAIKLRQLRLACLYHLQQHREAAEAAGEMIEKRMGDRADALNTRAYARAVGGFDLPAALTDIDEALDLVGGENPQLIDTRAYVLFKLGRTQEALDEINRAISLIEKERDQWELQGRRQLKPGNAAFLKEKMEQYDHHLAVMYYHRGEIQEKLGNEDEAKKDLFIGKQLGYDPDAGIY